MVSGGGGGGFVYIPVPLFFVLIDSVENGFNFRLHRITRK